MNGTDGYQKQHICISNGVFVQFVNCKVTCLSNESSHLKYLLELYILNFSYKLKNEENCIDLK